MASTILSLVEVTMENQQMDCTTPMNTVVFGYCVLNIITSKYSQASSSKLAANHTHHLK